MDYSILMVTVAFSIGWLHVCLMGRRWEFSSRTDVGSGYPGRTPTHAHLTAHLAALLNAHINGDYDNFNDNKLIYDLLRPLINVNLFYLNCASEMNY